MLVDVKKLSIVLGFIAVVFIAIWYVDYIQADFPDEKLLNSPTITDWKQYSDYNVNFEYPATWEVRKLRDAEEREFLCMNTLSGHPHGWQECRIEIWHSTSPFESELESLRNSLRNLKIKYKEVGYQGVAATEITAFSELYGEYMYAMVFNKKGVTYIIRSFWGNTETYRHLLNTFKVVNE